MLAHFGEKLRYLRSQKQISQRELAAHLGLAQRAYISNLEAGRKEPSLDLVIRIADYFNVTINYLIRDSIPIDPVEALSVPSSYRKPTENHFPDNLRALRINRGLTQAELPHLLGATRQGHISRLELGIKGPSLELVIKIADFFEVSIDDLIRIVLQRKVHPGLNSAS